MIVGWIRPALKEGSALVWAERRSLALVVGLLLVNRASAMVLPASSKFLIDDIARQQNAGLLLPVAAVLTAAVFLEATTGFALYRLVGLTSQRAITRLRVSLQAHVLRLPIQCFDDARSGTLVSRIMTDPETVRDVLGAGLVQLASGGLTALIAMVALFAIDARLTFVVLGILLGSFLGLTRGFGALYRSFLAVSERSAEITGRLAEVLGGIKVVKSHRAERREAHAFARESHRLLRDYKHAFTGAAAVVTASTLAAGVVNGTLLIVGGRSVVRGGMSVGELVMYFLLVGLLVTPLLQIAASASQVGQALAALGRIAQLRNREADDNDTGLPRLPRIAGRMAFSDVSFEYAPGRRVLRHVTFEAPAGTITALAGPNGAGKTTIAQLILGFHRPQEGRVLVDDLDLSRVRIRDYRAHVGFVPQDTILFQGTIADNIRYGRPSASSAEVREAARLAHCDEFVRGLPQGYATFVGERGCRLSGGERRRVAIARALLLDPRILVLDEATAYLDPESERMIEASLRTLCHGRTTFIIAHRFSAIQEADQILVLQSGTIIERGTHEELLTHRGRYRWLYETHQSRSEKEQVA